MEEFLVHKKAFTKPWGYIQKCKENPNAIAKTIQSLHIPYNLFF